MWSDRSLVQARAHTEAKARIAQALQEARARTDAKAQRRQARGGEKRTSQEKDIAIRAPWASFSISRCCQDTVGIAFDPRY